MKKQVNEKPENKGNSLDFRVFETPIQLKINDPIQLSYNSLIDFFKGLREVDQRQDRKNPYFDMQLYTYPSLTGLVAVNTLSTVKEYAFLREENTIIGIYDEIKKKQSENPEARYLSQGDALQCARDLLIEPKFFSEDEWHEEHIRNPKTALIFYKIGSLNWVLWIRRNSINQACIHYLDWDALYDLPKGTKVIWRTENEKNQEPIVSDMAHGSAG